MARFVTVKVFAPAPLRFPEVRARTLNVLQKYSKLIQADFQKTTATWQDHSPVFKRQVRYSGGFGEIKVTTGDRVWGYLNRGTSERWAVMSNDFLPKTTPFALQSSPGRGGAVLRGRSAMQKRGMSAMPGIEAREWTTVAADLYRDIVRQELKDAIRQGMRDAFAKGKR
jgi:hypothetical protein